MNKRKDNDIMGKIPNYFTFLGVLISLLSILAIVFAINVLFL